MKHQKCENSYYYSSMFQRTNFFLSKYTSKAEIYVSFHKSGTSNPFQTYFFELQTARKYRHRKRGTSRRKQSAFHWREKGVVMEKGEGKYLQPTVNDNKSDLQSDLELQRP